MSEKRSEKNENEIGRYKVKTKEKIDRKIEKTREHAIISFRMYVVLILFIPMYVVLNSLIISPVYGTNVIYNMLPSKISLDYKESRELPILFEVSDASKYRYKISFSSPYLKVFLLDKKGNPLPTVFTSDDLTLTTLITGNNKERKVHIAYVLLKYYRPSNGDKVNVNIEIMPLFSQFEGRYSSHISSSIFYTLTAYLNPYILPPNQQEGKGHYVLYNSYSSTPSSPPLNTETGSLNNGRQDDWINNNTSGAWSDGVEENQTQNNSYMSGVNNAGGEETIISHDLNRTKDIIHSFKDRSKEGQEKGKEGNNITGKFTFFSSSSFTILLMLLALVGLFVIYKKV